jgi:IPT/TIG domain
MRLIRVAVSALAVASIIVAARCAPIKSQTRQAQAENAVASGPPVIESARPDSVVLPYGGVVEVTLLGTGFIPGKPGQNTVHFSNTALKLVPASSDGRQIVFAIPDMISRGGEAPPSALRPGSYSVSVETNSGTSNAVTVRVFR